MARVVLIQPWVEDFYATDCRIQPIGLAYLAGMLELRAPEVRCEIIDMHAGGESRTIPWPRELEYLKRYYLPGDRSPFGLFRSFRRFGRSDAQLIERLQGKQPLLVGVSSLFTPYYRQTLDVARIVRSVWPEVPIVAGGNHATLHPQTLFEPAGLIDFVIRGEGEIPFVDLVRALLECRPATDVPNLLTHQDLPAMVEPLPPAASISPDPVEFETHRSLRPRFPGLDPDEYTYGKLRMGFLITSRSCPHRCSFCSIHAVFGTRYRAREPEDVMAEIEERFADGVRHFDIEDDNFTVNRAQVMRLLDLVIERGLPMTFSAMNGLSYISLDAELLARMKQAGFQALNLALVSSDLIVRRLHHRPHAVRKFASIVQAAGDLGLPVTAYLILGMPGQSVPEMWRTLAFLSAQQCLVGASPFYFTPGSPIWNKEHTNPALVLASSKHGDPYFAARLTALDLETTEFTRDDVYTLFRLTRLINHVKELLDRDASADQFAAAATVLREGAWPTPEKSAAPPFSRAVLEQIRGRPLVICGFRTNRSARWCEDHFTVQSEPLHERGTHGALPVVVVAGGR